MRRKDELCLQQEQEIRRLQEHLSERAFFFNSLTFTCVSFRGWHSWTEENNDVLGFLRLRRFRYNALRARPQDKLDETGNKYYRLVPCAAESNQCAMFEEQLDPPWKKHYRMDGLRATTILHFSLFFGSLGGGGALQSI